MLLLEYQQQLIFYYILHSIYYEFFEFPRKYSIKGIEKCKEMNVYSISSFNYTICGLFLMRYPLKSMYFQNFYPLFYIYKAFCVICLSLSISIINIGLIHIMKHFPIIIF